MYICTCAHMSRIMNEENEWDQIADADSVEGSIERVMIKDIMEAFNYLKIGKTKHICTEIKEQVQSL